MNRAAKILILCTTIVMVLMTATARANYDREKTKKQQAGKPAHTNYNALDSMRAKAKVSVNEVDVQNRYVDFLSPADLNKLPIGIKKKVGNTTVKIAVSSAVFTPQYAELTVYAKVEIPQKNTSNLPAGSNTGNKNNDIFFGVKGLKLSKDGGIIGDASLVLMGDYTIPLSGNKSALVLKGGMDITTGQAMNKTYITVDCYGFKELGLQADVVFPQSMIVPVNEQSGAVIKDSSVKGSFSTVVSNWNDIMASVTLPAFAIKGVNGVSFKVTSAVVDLSDYRNSADINYPPGYIQKYVGNDQTTINLWRGVYAKEIRVTLPRSFKDKSTSNPVFFGAKDLIIDNNGISGAFYGANVLPITNGTAGGWQFSVDSFAVVLEANTLKRAAFKGMVGLPVNKEVTASDTSNHTAVNKKVLNYEAMMSATGDYLCRVALKDSLSFEVWKANVILAPNSYIDMRGNGDQFILSAMLNGSMNLDSKTGTNGAERATKILDFKGIEFRKLLIQNQAPYVSADYFGINGSIKLGSLPVTIDSIRLKTFAPDELGLGFHLKVGFHENSFGGSTRLYVIGKYDQSQSLTRWQYNRIKVDTIALNCTIGAVSLNGMVAFLDNDPVYGDGFSGNLSMHINAGNITVTAAAVFGNAGYKYWFVDALATFPSIGSGVFNINGFGGGAYYRMKKLNVSAGLTPSASNYVPDSTAGLGLRASVLFNVGTDKLDQGQATLEIAFNRGGGMRFIGFYGYAKFMKSISTGMGANWDPLAFMKDQLKGVDSTIMAKSSNGMDSLVNKMIYQPTAAAKDITKITLPATLNVDLRAILGITYDFNNSVFHANFDLYANVGNIITGVGADGRAGWAVLHIETSKWYLYMGTPTDPIGIKLALGPLSVQTGSYFMMGYDLPAFPALPAALQALLVQNHINYQSNIGIGETNEIKAGRGVAFGANVQASTGDLSFLILYANFQAGMGFDVMMKDYSNYVCAETGQTPGINGWYAQGRVYAYLQGELGVKVKLLMIKKKIPIIKGFAAALLEGRLPNPNWFGGLFPVNVELLGGLVKVHVNLKFSFGSNCTLTTADNSNGNIDFNDFKVVSAVTPANNAQNVSIYNKPVITCSTPPNVQFRLPPDETAPPGTPDDTYRAQLTSIVITKAGQTISSTYKMSADSSRITVYPDAGYDALTNYVLNIKITYQKLVSGAWVTVTDNGQPAIELTTINFTTGNYPNKIEDDNLGFSYPYKGQKFLYKDEFNTGRVLLINANAPLLNSSSSWKARFTNTATGTVLGTTPVTLDAARKALNYPLPAGLENSKSYKMEIYGDAWQPGSIVTDTTQPIYQCNFSTSQYGTLAAKLNALNITEPIVGRVASDVIDLEAKVANYEGFDAVEVGGNTNTNCLSLVAAEAVLADNPYFTNTMKALIHYPPNNITNGDTLFYNYTVSRDTSIYGAAPSRAMITSSYYYTASLGAAYNSVLFNRFPFLYAVDELYNNDFTELRTKIINRYLTNMANPPNKPMYTTVCHGSWIFRYCLPVMDPDWVVYLNSAAYLNSLAGGNLTSVPQQQWNIILSPFPFMPQGNYKARFSVRRPVSMISATAGFNYENGNWTNFTYQNPIQ